MDTFAVQSIKTTIVAATGLSKDALHVYVGLAVLLLVAIALRKPLRSLVPWLAVVAVALLGELVDWRDDLARLGYWQWWASLHDLANTIFWPSALMLAARLRALRGGD